MSFLRLMVSVLIVLTLLCVRVTVWCTGVIAFQALVKAT